MNESRKATPHKELMRQLLDSTEPKTEREHAAARTIDELLEALEEALDDWDDSHFDEEYPFRIEWADKARAAIAKARGEE